MSSLSTADTILLKLIRSGDKDGWSQLVSRFQGRLVAFAGSQVGQDADVEDVVQETFIGFLKAIPTYREDASPETMLVQILRRRIIDVFRSRGRNRTLQFVQSDADD